MNHAILIVLRAYIFDLLAPLLGISMGVAMGSSSYAVMAVLGLVFIALTLVWLATMPRKGDMEWRPFYAHLTLSALAFVGGVVALSALNLSSSVPDARCIVLGVAGGFVGILVASSCSPPLEEV